MPALPPDLAREIRAFFEPFFRLEVDRPDQLAIPLGAWEGYSQIVFEGSAYDFSQRLIFQLPDDQLKAVLASIASDSGEIGQQQADGFQAAIDDATRRMAAAAAGSLRAYYQSIVRDLSSPRYELDRRFVQLTMLLDQGPEAQGVRFVPDMQQRQYDSLVTLQEEIDDRALVLLGRPGSGKTTLLKRLQLEVAWEELAGSTGKVAFFAPLNAFRGPHRGAPPPPPRDWLAGLWRSQMPQLDDFETLLVGGRLLLLLDGLNEIPHSDAPEYRERVEQWRDFVQQTLPYGNTVFFSCRSLDYSASLSSEAVPVRQVRVEPLAPAQIEDFLQQHLGDGSGAAVYEQLRKDERQLELYSTPFFLRLLAGQIGDSGEMPAGQAALLTGFVRRTLHREVVERHHHLFEPDGLLSADDAQQVIQKIWDGPFDLPGEGLLIPRLAALAFAMQDSKEEGEASQVRVKEKEARDLLALPQARDLIAAGIQLNVLDKDLARREILFYHQLIQEYFAARVLAHEQDAERVFVPWRVGETAPALEEEVARLEISDPLPGLPATGWEETTLLAAAMAHDQDQFVGDLIAANLPLAARCAAAPEVTVSSSLVQTLQEALLARIGDAQADLRARIAAAETLGELGDPRFQRREGPFGPYLLPPLAAIAGGTYTIGADEGPFDDEKPAHPVPIRDFEMGLFPVTNAEYALFIKAGGYDNLEWWETEAAQAWLRGEGSSEGQKAWVYDVREQLQGLSDEAIRAGTFTPEQIEAYLWIKHANEDELEAQLAEWYPEGKIYKEPEFWSDGRFNPPAQPAVGVTWFEARAYCAWLSEQTGERYELPSEAEWEAAARGLEGRDYAYGRTFDAARCNTFETHIRRTTPVGVFPGGRTPDTGIYDLSGNIWEWTSSIYKPYRYDPADGRDAPQDAAARRVLRGGSWRGDRDLARAASRSGSDPRYRDFDDGFRVVR
ncbi:MAG: SUMF1/EgtB/PvdO family nonheme iron enzyme, partial [Candidatus Promineifilaceae bacterium]